MHLIKQSCSDLCDLKTRLLSLEFKELGPLMSANRPMVSQILATVPVRLTEAGFGSPFRETPAGLAPISISPV